MNIHLSEEKCTACEGGTPTLTEAEYAPLLAELPADWNIVGSKVLTKEFSFRDFREALIFVNKVGEIAETENHHPDINLHNYKQVMISLSTHAIGGLSRNDFILASKIENLF